MTSGAGQEPVLGLERRPDREGHHRPDTSAPIPEASSTPASPGQGPNRARTSSCGSSSAMNLPRPISASPRGRGKDRPKAVASRMQYRSGWSLAERDFPDRRLGCEKILVVEHGPIFAPDLGLVEGLVGDLEGCFQRQRIFAPAHADTY